MPEAVLAGPDGQPAIDQATGMPLTMEELLRRRGILSYKGVTSPLNSSLPVDPATTANDVIDSASNIPSSVAPAVASVSNTPNTTNVPVADATGNPVVAVSTPVINKDEIGPEPQDGDSDNLTALLASLGIGGAALYGASKLGKRASGVNSGSDTVDAVVARGPTVNSDLVRVDQKGSNRQLSTLVDGKNVTKAGELGAGPKRLNGPAPVRDVSGDNLTGAVAGRSRRLNDLTSKGPVSTRQQIGARQANNSRMQRPGDQTITLDDKFTDLTQADKQAAAVLAERMRADQVSGHGKLPARIGTTAVAKRNSAAKATLSNIAPPSEQDAQALREAMQIVRKLKAAGPTNVVAKLIPRLRIP